jgi:hypothetical protein
MPRALKQHLGLDLKRSWMMVNDADQFIWRSYDLRKISAANEFHYETLPPTFSAKFSKRSARIANVAK